MSALVVLQTKDELFFGTDSAVSTSIGDSIYRLSEDGRKIFLVEGKVVFCSGNMDLSYSIMDAFANSKNKSVYNLKNIAIDRYRKSNISKDVFNLEIVVGQIINKKACLYQISPYNDFEIIETKIDDGVSVWSAGIKTRESFDNMSKNILSKRSIIQSYVDTFDKISYEGIGGNLNIYQLNSDGAKEIYRGKIKEKEIKYFNLHNVQKHLIIGERVIGKIIMGHNLIMGDPDGMLEILGNKGVVRDRCLDPRPDTPTYLRGREVMRFGLYNYDINNVDDYRNPHPTDISQDRFGIQLFGNFSDALTVDNTPPILGNSAGLPQIYNAQPLSRVTMDSQEGFYLDKWENIGDGYDWYKKFYVNDEGSLFAEDMTTYRLKILQKPGVLLLDAEERFINIGRMAEMVLDGALTPLEKIQVRTEWARIQKEFVELQKAYLDHRYTYRGGDAYGNKSNIDHLNTPSSPAWAGTSFSGYSTGFWNSFQSMYNALNKYLNLDVITLPSKPNYPNGSLLSDARKHITERENDLDDNGEVLEMGTGFSRSIFVNTFTDYYNATKVLVDAINTLIRWASTELGKFYNDIRMDAEDGIVVTRSDNTNQIWMSATDGFSIAKNKNDLYYSYYPFLEYSKPGAEISGSRTMQSWQKLFYADTDGNLNLLGSLDMLSLDNQTRVLIDQNSPEGIPFSIMGRTRSIGMEGAVRDGERYSDHTGEWWRKLYIDTDGNLFANDLTANRLILRDIDGDVVLDANSGFFDLNKFHFNGNLLAQNIVTGTILADVGHVADLTVNRLKSIDLTKEGKEANYIDIENQYIRWITASLQATSTQRTQMALNRETEEMEMMPLYWTDSSRTSTTTYPEDYSSPSPVYEQAIVNPVTKMEMNFDESGPNSIPKITLGAGTGNGDRGKGFIFKSFPSASEQSLMIQYIDTTGKAREVKLDNTGVTLTAGNKSVVVSEGDGIKLTAGSKVVTIPETGGIKVENGNGSLIEFSSSDINITATGKVNIKGTEIHLNA